MAKYILEYVKQKIEEMHPGCKVLSSEYVNSKEKLDILCENNHLFKMSWSCVNSKHWCCECSNENKRKKIQFSYDYVKSYIETKHVGAKLLSKEYVNSHGKLKILCENNHVFYKIFTNIKHNDSWCAECGGTKKYTIEYVKSKIKKMHPGSKVISEEYKNSKTKLDLICENGHDFKKAYEYVKSGQWCGECNGHRRYDIGYVRKYIGEIHPNSKLLDDIYKNITSKLNLICENGHKFETSFKLIKAGCWCGYCFERKGEKYCREIFENLFNEKFEKIKPKWLINPKTNRLLELDGFCENLKIAFEYNGYQHYKAINIFHKTEQKFIDQKNRDITKNRICKENNIILLNIRQFKNFRKDYMEEAVLNEVQKYPRLAKLIRLSCERQS